MIISVSIVYGYSKINSDVIIILVYLRYCDLERDHGLSANQGVIIRGHITVIQITSAKFFPLIELRYFLP